MGNDVITREIMKHDEGNREFFEKFGNIYTKSRESLELFIPKKTTVKMKLN